MRSVLLCLVKNRKLLTCTLKQGRVSMRMMLRIKLHLVGYLLTRYFKDARYHERKILELVI